MATSTVMISPSSSLSDFPSELILHILSFLDIPDLLFFSRTSHLLRHLSLDPLLHSFRLHRASITIERWVVKRPSLAELMAHRIYITRTTLAAKTLGRNLIKIKLNHKLLARPSAEALVQNGILPAECYGQGVAPGLVGVKRRIEKERIKDLLRGWVEEWRRRGSEVVGRQNEGTQRINVRRMAKRFGREGSVTRQVRWGAGAGTAQKMEIPTRAKVLGLRKFWEGVAR